MAEGEATPIVDAHQHFWDLERNYYPWLCDPELIPFRYGDYSAIRQTYLPPDYRRDAAGFDVVKTVHIEAEHDRARPVADRSDEGLAAWRRGLETVADCDNVALRISGLGRPGQPWTLEANGPVIRDAIAIFGTDRCMFASNYPVDRLAGSFKDIFSGFQAAWADFSGADRLALFHDNAERIYRL